MYISNYVMSLAQLSYSFAMRTDYLQRKQLPLLYPLTLYYQFSFALKMKKSLKRLF
jgi:hypothetical protein